jgi:hypothetical protein
VAKQSSCEPTTNRKVYDPINSTDFKILSLLYSSLLLRANNAQYGRTCKLYDNPPVSCRDLARFCGQGANVNTNTPAQLCGVLLH